MVNNPTNSITMHWFYMTCHAWIQLSPPFLLLKIFALFSDICRPNFGTIMKKWKYCMENIWETCCGERLNNCNQSDFSSDQESYLSPHMKSHSEETWNKCDFRKVIWENAKTHSRETNAIIVTMLSVGQVIWVNLRDICKHIYPDPPPPLTVKLTIKDYVFFAFPI